MLTTDVSFSLIEVAAISCATSLRRYRSFLTKSLDSSLLHLITNWIFYIEACYMNMDCTNALVINLRSYLLVCAKFKWWFSPPSPIRYIKKTTLVTSWHKVNHCLSFCQLCLVISSSMGGFYFFYKYLCEYLSEIRMNRLSWNIAEKYQHYVKNNRSMYFGSTVHREIAFDDSLLRVNAK